MSETAQQKNNLTLVDQGVHDFYIAKIIAQNPKFTYNIYKFHSSTRSQIPRDTGS